MNTTLMSFELEVTMTHVQAFTADEWRDIASESFVPLSFQKAASGFTATLDRRELAPRLSLSRISSHALVIERTPRLAAHALSDDVHLSLQVGSTGSVIQNGNAVGVGPGIVTLCETHKPFMLDYSRPGQKHIVLQISREMLGVDDSIISSLAGTRLAHASPARSAYVSFVAALMADRGPVPESVRLDTGAIVASLATAMVHAESAYESVLPDHGEALLVMVLEFIGAHLTSPLLTPSVAARAHFISRRRLYELFELIDETPSSYIRAQRLDRAAVVLEEDHRHEARIADLAYGMGFGDVTTFTRAFARRFGLTPRDYRVRATRQEPSVAVPRRGSILSGRDEAINERFG